MYHGKYSQETRVRDSTAVQWWLTAGCCGLIVTMAFVAFTLWLGMEGPRKVEPTSADFGYNRPPPVYRRAEDPRNVVRPSRGKVEKVHKDEEEVEEKKPTHLKLPIPQAPVLHRDEEEIRNYQGTLDHGEELMRETGVKDSSIKKKSEAVYPSGYDPEFYLPPRVINPINARREESPNHFVHYAKPEIPPFTYIKATEGGIEERIDNAVNNYFSYPSEGDTESESSLGGFLRQRLMDVKDWLMTRGDQNANSEWVQVISAFNQSIAQRNLTSIMSKLKDLYNSTDVADVPVSSILYPDSQNGSSILSFGLLAVDLFLLHNVQQIAWNEEAQLGDQMLDDPEVVAMNALFLSPDRVKQLRQKGSRLLKAEVEETNKSSLTEALEFVNSMLRAILNLNKAYRSSTAANRSRGTGPSTMDCIWTLYCRNLDKTARLHGPYGFLAKMNSLGLRMMMGEFPVERAFTQLIAEATTGWRHIDCLRLFPRCGVEEAKDIVMNTVLSDSPAHQT
ncbi:uncharacterized protein LOC128982761 [Macrosteles quadrilineatus]|uniref:uncharacterized protein LOC128982761 n=1 Tax=Macrosteles quadrilineatus TaxID=74068 RepID=UPI0023E0D6F8|nr:uncharacterized protein LOC128982761 [Macrosteles quadrilineatus]